MLARMSASSLDTSHIFPVETLPFNQIALNSPYVYSLSKFSTTWEGPMVGETISHLKIIDKLGQGSEVYGAQDTSLERRLALKYLPTWC